MAGSGEYMIQAANQRIGGYLAQNYNPGDYGAAQGYLDSQKNQRENNQDARQERVLGMQEEKFGWDREAHQKEQIINAGMADAAKDGGYEGVISYLEKADPERALKFTDAKLSLDDHIMKNDVMKNITIPSMKEDALLESYSKLGQMGQAILKAPPADREAMFQQLLPIAKVINPNMPDTLEAAAPTFLLAAAQATPANILFSKEKAVVQAQSAVGRTNADIKTLLDTGVNIDDQTADGDSLRALYAERERTQAMSAQAGAKLTQTQLQPLKDQNQATQLVGKNLAQASVITPEYIDSYLGVKAANDVLAKDPNNPQAQAAMGRSFVKTYNKGQASDQDNAIQYGTYGLSELWKKVQAMTRGEAVNLTANDSANIAMMNEAMMKRKLETQKNIESQFETSVSDKTDLVDWNKVPKPSQMLISANQQATANTQAANGQIPQDLQALATKYLQQGADPQKVNALVQKKMQERAQAGQQQVNPNLTPSDYVNR